MTVDLSAASERFAYPNPLPKPPPRGMARSPISAEVGIALRDFFARRPDALAAGGGYVCADLDDTEKWVVPDAVVAFGVDPEAILVRNGYVASEVGKPPDFVLDIALGELSEADKEMDLILGMGLNEDYARKSGIYAGFGVPEIWRFATADARRDGHPALSAGRLADGEYRPIEIVHEPDGVIWGRSAVLGMDLCSDEGKLRLRVPTGGEYLRSHLDEKRGRLEAEAKWLETETERRRERLRRLEAEAEIRRLQDRLRQAGAS